MIYVVKCFYCEHEFKVKRGETGADIMCPECGHANSIKDVIERIEEESDKEDSELQAIKDYDSKQHPVAILDDWVDVDKRRKRRRVDRFFYVLIGIVIILHLLGVIDVWAIMEKIDSIF